jgi:uncharacterized protein YbjT (DUF2867 family)
VILVVGGTGELGGRVVRLLRERGEQVRCLVRPASNDAELRRRDVEIVRGDLAGSVGLADAVASADVVVATATAIARRLAGDRSASIRAVDQDGMSALVRAAEHAGVRRFVYVSYAGVDESPGSPLSRAKLAVEQQLATSTMQTVIVRPDAFQEIHLAPLGRFDIAGRKVAVFGSGDTRLRWVAVDDVAALISSVAVEPDPPELIEFGGPEAISRNELINRAERATGRSIKRQRMPRAAASFGMRVLARPNDALASVFGLGVHQDLVAPDWDDGPLRERGIEPKPASRFIDEQIRELH